MMLPWFKYQDHTSAHFKACMLTKVFSHPGHGNFKFKKPAAPLQLVKSEEASFDERWNVCEKLKHV